MTEDRDDQESERQTAYTFIEDQKTKTARLRAERNASRGIASLLALPSYFSDDFGYTGAIKTDYDCPKGINCSNAEAMLNETIFRGCKCVDEDTTSFEVVAFRRIENRAAWERFRLHEHQVRNQFALKSPEERARSLAKVPPAHAWIAALEAANGLSADSNSLHLLHGTKADCLESISTNGLSLNCAGKFGGNEPLYGCGVYFARESCKACQYTGGALKLNDDVKSILVCRVALGNIYTLPERCRDELFLDGEYHSAKAVGGETQSSSNRVQLHDEFVVYESAACYPEFILDFHLREF